MANEEKHFKISWILWTLLWWLFCFVFFNPFTEIHLENSSLDQLRQIPFVPLLWAPLPVLSILLGTKYEGRFKLAILIPTVLSTVLSFLLLPLFWISTYSQLNRTEELVVGTHRVRFYLRAPKSFKDWPGISIRDETSLGFGLNWCKPLTSIYRQDKIEPKVIDDHTFSYVVEALMDHCDYDSQLDRRQNLLVVYDFDAQKHIRVNEIPNNESAGCNVHAQ